MDHDKNRNKREKDILAGIYYDLETSDLDMARRLLEELPSIRPTVEALRLGYLYNEVADEIVHLMAELQVLCALSSNKYGKIYRNSINVLSEIALDFLIESKLGVQEVKSLLKDLTSNEFNDEAEFDEPVYFKMVTLKKVISSPLWVELVNNNFDDNYSNECLFCLGLFQDPLLT